MRKDHTLSLRVNDEQKKRIDEAAKRLVKETGMDLTKAQVLQRIIALGLDALDKTPKKPKEG